MSLSFNLKKIFGLTEKTVVGVDIGASSIKVVELKREKGKAVLTAYGNIALGPYGGGVVGSIPTLSNEKIGEALRDVLKEAGIKSKSSGVAIPFKSSLVSLIEMPFLPEKKLEEMIPMEARKYIPVPIAEVTMDWWIVPREKYDSVEEAKINEEKKKTDVLVVSIHNEILSNYNDMVKLNSLDASFFEIEMFSATRALVGREDKPVMVFDMGAAGTKLYVIEKGIIRASHIINHGSKDITESIAKSLGAEFAEAEKIKRNISSLNETDQKRVLDIVNASLDPLWTETKNIIGSYELRHGKKLSKIIVTGGGTALAGFVPIAEKSLNLKIEKGDSFGKVDTPPFLSETLHSTGFEFAVAIGVAIRKLEEN